MKDIIFSVTVESMDKCFTLGAILEFLDVILMI